MDSEPWWAPREIAVGQRWTTRAGFSDLTVEHNAGEWRVQARSSDPRNPSSTSVRPVGALRIASSSASDTMQLHPRLANRPIVARLEVPLLIAPDEEATIYVGSPLWAEFELDPPNGTKTGEIPLYFPPNTWFGHNTRSGELCYASRTRGRLHIRDIEHNLDRAITAVVVHNSSRATLCFERIKLSVPHLTLFHAGDGTLWTNRVLVNHGGVEPPREEIESGPPEALALVDLVELAPSREPMHEGLLAKALGVLL